MKKDKVLQAIQVELSKGVVPWSSGITGLMKHTSIYGNIYQGINALSCAMSASKAGYNSLVWLTYSHAMKLGGHVLRGEKGTCIDSFSKAVLDEGTEKERIITRRKVYVVFNTEQCTGVAIPDDLQTVLRDNKSNNTADSVVAGYNDCPIITVQNNNEMPRYNLANDSIYIPAMDRFVSSDSYYDTLFHEMIHSTGHKSRLHRSTMYSLDKVHRAREEQVAELGAAFLCGHANITTTVQNNASYIDGWMQVSKDTQMLHSIIQAAKAAADYILQG